MVTLDRKALLEKEKVQIREVDLGNGNCVYVRQMSGRERDHFEQSLIKQVKNNKGQVESYEQNLEDFRAKLVAATVCTAEGDILLQPSDIPTLSKNMSAVTLDKIVKEAQDINKISEADKEELTKNSEAVPDGSSSSDSVGN